MELQLQKTPVDGKMPLLQSRPRSQLIRKPITLQVETFYSTEQYDVVLI